MTEFDALACLRPLIASTGSTLSPGEFHAAVDRAFHDSEAPEYDSLHAAMWQSLPQQFSLLADDVALHPEARLPSTLVAADIGCGTGQSAEALLQTSLGPRIAHIDLVDPSKEMLARAADRARRWSTPHSLYLGGIEALPERRYDLLLTCSVLHHIPDLPAFLSVVRTKQAAGGLFFHVQDPNAAALRNPEALARAAKYKRSTQSGIPEWLKRLTPRRVLGRIWREVRRTRRRPTYIDQANTRLLASRAIARPMTAAEFWSVTDIRVDGLPYSSGGGIALESVREALVDYQLLSARSYAFFGEVYHGLPSAFQPIEQSLIQARAMNGHTLAAAWKRST